MILCCKSPKTHGKTALHLIHLLQFNHSPKNVSCSYCSLPLQGGIIWPQRRSHLCTLIKLIVAFGWLPFLSQLPNSGLMISLNKYLSVGHRQHTACFQSVSFHFRRSVLRTDLQFVLTGIQLGREKKTLQYFKNSPATYK